VLIVRRVLGDDEDFTTQRVFSIQPSAKRSAIDCVRASSTRSGTSENGVMEVAPVSSFFVQRKTYL